GRPFLAVAAVGEPPALQRATVLEHERRRRLVHAAHAWRRSRPGQPGRRPGLLRRGSVHRDSLSVGVHKKPRPSLRERAGGRAPDRSGYLLRSARTRAPRPHLPRENGFIMRMRMAMAEARGDIISRLPCLASTPENSNARRKHRPPGSLFSTCLAWLQAAA